jgi:hypothetical protein
MLMSAAVVALCLFAVGALAEEKKEKKEVTLKGEIMCAKCELKETKKCTTAIVVKDGDKTVTYYFLDQGSKEDYHEEVCGGGRKEGKVTGTVSVKGGKKWITPTKVEYTKK